MVVIPEGVVKILDFAFCQGGITGIKIPSSVKVIGDGAFAWCEKLKEVEIASGLEKMHFEIAKV